ncbi:MAG: hypothetical protein WCB58_22305 [Acidobacteriaceae bacterium]
MEGFPADLGDVYSHEGYNDTQETNHLHNVDYRKHFALERLNIIRRHLTKPISFTRLLDVGRVRNRMVSRSSDAGRLCYQRPGGGQRDSGGRSQRGCYGNPGDVRLEKRTAGDP